MASKRPIDERRDAALFMEVGDISDSSPLQEILQVGEQLLILKQRSIWQVRLADEVDPSRVNDRIPNSQQKLLSRGTSDAHVARVLLQAKRLLKSELLPKVSVNEGLSASLDFLKVISDLQDKADDYRRLTENLTKDFVASDSTHDGLSVPAVTDVTGRGKAFVQLADHAVRGLWQLARAFWPDLPPGVAWEKLKTKLDAGDADATRVAGAVESLAKRFIFLRNTRNAMEHPKPGQQVIFEDYTLKADGNVHPPAITVVEKNTPLSETALDQYFAWVIDLLVDSFEILLVNFCSLSVGEFSGFKIVVTELEPSQRRYPSASYAYATWFGNRLVPYSG